jgi:pyruvate ferredoxin oxidoreductase alpha subunit
MRKFLEGSHAIAEAVKLCKPKVISAYPITPQTHIVEKLSEMVANGELNAEYLNVESEHSAMASCIGAQATGVRTFTASAGQGIALMWELLYIASGMRLPIVMAVANRALSSPLNIWGDWSDSIGCRDTGWIQLYCKNSQEAFDTIIQAYKIGEHEDIMLPVMVCVDGFYLSHTYEPVDIIESVGDFLPEYRPVLELNPENPVTQGAYATPEYYQEFKEIHHRTIENAKHPIKKINSEFNEAFGRIYGDGLVETYNMDNAEYAIVTMGTVAGTIKNIIDENKIKDIGLVRIKSFRPFPKEELKKIMKNINFMGILEKNISLGSGGALFTEIRSCVNKPAANFIAGLGGRDVSIDDIKRAFEIIRKEDESTKWMGSNLGDKNE